MKIPKGHHIAMPYLILKDATQFIDFIDKVFNVKPSYLKFREDHKTVIHCEIEMGDSTILLCDATEEWEIKTSNLFIYVENADKCYRKAIENGATTVMELVYKDYGQACGIKEIFGNTWWITSIDK